jgi:MoaA/NifB/PqqE/SkfB family radical SAM enzyme
MAGENRMNGRVKIHPNQQAITHWITLVRNGLGEIKFVKSWQDLKILYDKFAYFLPRAVGSYEKVGGVPPSIQIEPTNYCNARCICCSTSRSSRQRGFMDFELFKKIIDDAAQSKIKRVHLYLHGEPMLHPKIVEMIGYIKARKLSIHLTTNGMLFNRNKIIAILNSNVNFSDHFVFSILGGSKEVHEVTMKRVNHERVISNISTFLALRKEYHMNGPVIETMFYPMPENQHEVNLYLKTYQGYVDHARVASAISSSFSQHNTINEGQNIKPRIKTCSQLWERLTIFWNGDVTLCPQDIDGDRVFGNLAKQSIREVCVNEDLLDIKRIHKQRLFEKLPFCHACDW